MDLRYAKEAEAAGTTAFTCTGITRELDVGAEHLNALVTAACP